MPVVIINGKRTLLPSSTATVNEIVKVSDESTHLGGRAVYRTTPGGEIERMDPRMRYPVKSNESFMTGPDRVKGADETYFSGKEPWRKELIADQVADIAENVFQGGDVELDENCDWVVFTNFLLPEEWARMNPMHKHTRMMLIFPDEFPDLPTNGFYLPKYIRAPRADHHLFNRGLNGAFGWRHEDYRELRTAGWNWFCSHITPSSWHPARLRRISDWRQGDNIYHIVALAREVLTDPYAS